MDRVELARDVSDVVARKAAYDVSDRVGLPDVRQELIAQALPLGCTPDQAGNVDELDDCVHRALRLHDPCNRFQTLVGHADDAHIGLNGAERVIFRRDFSSGERVEQRRFADVGQADDAAFEPHGPAAYSD